MLIVNIVRKIDSETIWIVNTRYLPSSGTTSDVGGIISRNGKKNKVNARRIDMQRVIFSPDFVDSENTMIVIKPKLMHGIIKFIT